jgi:hypothetical protein
MEDKNNDPDIDGIRVYQSKSGYCSALIPTKDPMSIFEVQSCLWWMYAALDIGVSYIDDELKVLLPLDMVVKPGTRLLVTDLTDYYRNYIRLK